MTAPSIRAVTRAPSILPAVSAADFWEFVQTIRMDDASSLSASSPMREILPVPKTIRAANA